MRKKFFTFLMIIALMSTLYSVQGFSELYGPNDSSEDYSPMVIQQGNSITNPEITRQSYTDTRLDDKPNSMHTLEVLDDEETSIQSRYERYLAQHQERQDLPENYRYWADSTVSNLDSFSKYLSKEAVIKIFEGERIELVVKMDQSAISSQLNSLFGKYDAKVIRNYESLSALTVTVPEYKVARFVEEVGGLVEISYVEPNFYSQVSLVPNDPEWPYQYGPQIIGMESVWDLQLGSTDVLVAIIDTGIDYTHPDLANYLPLGYDFYNDDNDPMDDHGHGTHVAGTIAASINNGLGVAGVGNVSFFAEKFLDEFGYGSDIDGAASIMHATDQGADILSNSWGGYGYSQILADAVQYALDAGVMVIAASGNGATSEPHYPAALPGVMSVGATDSYDELAYFSNYGETLDIVAPGVDIISTYLGGTYAYNSGTSMATPHVSGLLAVLMSHYPEYSPSMLENLLYSTAVDLGEPGWDQYFGHGRIDGLTAIYGLQDHDLVASINAPSVVPINTLVSIDLAVRNNGLYNETNVGIRLFQDSVEVFIDIIAHISPGETINLNYEFFADSYTTYLFDFEVDAVPGENIIGNNMDSMTIVCSAPVIYPMEADEFAYGFISDNATIEVPFDRKFVVHEATDLTNVEIGWYSYDPEFNETYLMEVFYLNAITRETSAIWEVFPYWIDPNVQVGDMINLFSKGAPDAQVVDELIYSYYGQDIEVWVVDDGAELVFFSKADGILMTLADYSYTPFFFSMTYTTILPDAIDLVNIRSILIEPVMATLNEPSEIKYFIHNTGEYGVEAFIDFEVAGNLIGVNLFLDSGEYSYGSVFWTPLDLGYYDLYLSSYIAGNESYYDDNYDYALVSVIDLSNYDLSYPVFDWKDAATNGFNLGVSGDDTYTTLDLPFTFEFYDMAFNQVHISSNGWLSFYESDPWEYYSSPFPTDEHPYAVAPFFGDLIAENNIYAWVTPEFVVIEYSNYYYLGGELAGTFEVILYANGDIDFQYLSMGPDWGVIKGVNYGLNLAYYTLLEMDLSYASNFSARFSTGGSGGDIDMLEVGMYVPMVEEGQSEFIYAWVTNVANETMYDVLIYLYIDDMIKSAMYTEILPAGQNLTLMYYWMNVDRGYYEIKTEAPGMPGEQVLDNNVVTEQLKVGKDHDIAVYLDIYFDGGMYVITAIVENIGDFDEYNIIIDIFIDTVLVNVGYVGYLEKGTIAALGYFWSDYTEGTYEITASAYPVPEEENLADNIATETLIIGGQEFATVNFIVVDNFTMAPIAGAEIYINHFETNTTIFGYTDEFGMFETQIPLGESYISIYANGYEYFDTFAYFDYPDYYEFWVALLPQGSELAYISFDVVDAVSYDPIEGAEVILYNYDTDELYLGYTDMYGFIDFDISLGEYFISVNATGYEGFFTYEYILEPVYIGYYVELYPIAQTETTTVAFQVNDADTGMGLEFVEIQLYNPISGDEYFGYTNASGGVEFLIYVGSYYIYAYLNGYEAFDAMETFDIPDVYYGYFIALVPFASGGLAFLEFEVMDNATGLPLDDAFIYLYNPQTGQDYFGVTDEFGRFYLNVTTGEYFVEISKYGYNYFQTIEYFDQPDTYYYYPVYMIPWGSEGSTTVYIELFDELTLEPVSYVDIHLSNTQTGQYYNILTDEFGIWVGNISIGEYYISTNPDGYLEYYTFEMFDMPDSFYGLTIYLTPVSSLETATVNFVVFDSNTSLPIANAEIYLYNVITGQNYYFVTDADGQVVENVTLGEYYIDVYAMGYQSNFFYTIIDIANGWYELPVPMEIINTTGVAYLEFNVYDDSTSIGIENAEIYLYNTNTNETFWGYTDTNGYWFTEVPLGYYIISVSAYGYEGIQIEDQFQDPDAWYGFGFYLRPEIVQEITTVLFEVYDNSTGLPISGVNIDLINLYTHDYYYGITDDFGQWIANITVGEYQIDMYSYEYNHFHANALFDQAGAFYVYTAYMLPWASNPMTTVYFEVVDETTLEPISNLFVYLSNSDTGQFFYGVTDQYGTLLLNVSIGYYFIEFDSNQYLNYYFDALIDVENSFYEFYIALTPLSSLPSATVRFAITDFETGIAIPNVYIYMFNSDLGINYNFHTDEYGILVVNVTLGNYYVDIYLNGYLREYFDTLLDVENSLYEFNVALTPVSSLPSTTVSFEIVDLNTGSPIPNAEIYMHNSDYDVNYEFVTDEYGLLVVNVSVGYYYINVQAFGYQRLETNEMFDTPDSFYMVFLQLDYAPTKNISILSPLNGEILEGGIVYIEFTADDINSINTIDVYINGLYLMTLYTQNPVIGLPIFNNGTNMIELFVQWNDGSVGATNVTIDSYNVVPLIGLEIGDYISFRLESQNEPLYSMYDFYMIGWVSQYEAYFNFTLTSYDNGTITSVDYMYMVVNVLNGYISDTDSGWDDLHFFFFNAKNIDSTGRAVFLWWHSPYNLIGETTWNGYDAWILKSTGTVTTYILKANGLLTYYEAEGYSIGNVVDTSLLPATTSFLDLLLCGMKLIYSILSKKC